MYSSSRSWAWVKKTASATLAVFLFISPLNTFLAEAYVLNTPGGEVYVPNSSSMSSGVTSVNVQSGSMTYSYDFTNPDGRNKLSPGLSLQYDSSNRDNFSHAGYGWTITLPSINRINKTGSENIFDELYFEADLDGELVHTGSQSYIAKFDSGEFRDYSLSNNVWSVTDKQGVTYTFGSTTNSRLSNPNDSTEVHTWYLSEIRDANDNFIKYEYSKDNATVYLDTVTYTGHGTTDGIYEVDFVYETRPDVMIKGYGFLATTTKRLSEVTVSESGSWFRKYDLGYTSGQNTNRSLLETIVETGQANGVQIQKPTTTFAYESFTSSDQSWSEDTSRDVPERLINDRESRDLGVRFLDVNGDGLQDLVKSNKGRVGASSAPIEKVYLNTGEDWELSTSWTLPAPNNNFAFVGSKVVEAGPFDLGARFADVNGDGYIDILWGYKGQCNGCGSYYNYGKVYINNTVDGWDEDTNYALPSDVSFSGEDINKQGVTIIDVNGDDLPDLLKYSRYTINGTTHHIKNTYINTGNGWNNSTSTWSLPEPIMLQYSDAGTRFADINGDGLIDLIRHSDLFNGLWEDADRAWLNTGDGWILAESWKSPIPFTEGSTPNPIVFSDLNGDGLVDIFAYATGSFFGVQKIFINNGEGWDDETSSWSFNSDMIINFQYSGTAVADAGVRLVDVDGDNMIDFVKDGPIDASPVQYVDKVQLHDGKVTDLLSEVTQSEGGTMTVTYKQSAQYEDSSGDNLNPGLPLIVDTVEKISYDSGFGNEYDVDFEYGDGHYYYSSSTDRKFAGFGMASIVTDTNKEVTYYHQGNNVSTTSEEITDDQAFTGRTYRTEIYDLSDNLYQLSRQNYATSSVSGGGVFAKLISDLIIDYDGDGDHKDKAVAYTYSSDHGSVLSMAEYGEVSGDTDGTFTDTGSDDRMILYEYATNTNGVVLPSKRTLKDDSNNTVAESRYYYDSQSLGSVVDGNLTKQEDWLAGSTYVDSEWTYNTYGLKITETDPNGNTTIFGYDTNNLFIASTTNAEGHNTQYTYDYSSGQVATTTNPNGEVFATAYDSLDRPLAVSEPDPQTGDSVIKTEYAYTDTAGAVSMQQTNYLSSSIDQNIYTYLDGFGRVIQERVEAEDSNQYVVRDFVYGLNGLLKNESLPYFDSGTSRSTATTNSDLLTNYEYDALERVVAAGNAVGTTTTSYDQWVETVTDTLNNDKEFTYDAYNRLLTVTENEGVSSYDTDYVWDDLDNLTKITDADGNVRNILYDGLSRRTSLEDLHDTSDSNYGVWLFGYDDAGNISSTTDPEGQVINYTYDDINRILTENYLGQTGTEITYTYDSCTDGVGYLCQVVNNSVTTNYTYTPNGLQKSETRVIAGNTFTTEYEYDLQGNQTLITYPDDSEVRYTYNKGNQVEQVEQRESGGSFADIVQDLDYGPHGLMTYQLLGNEASTTRTYNEEQLYRLESILTTASSSFGTGGPGQELLVFEGGFFGELSSGTETEVEVEEVVEVIEEPAEDNEELEIDIENITSTTEAQDSETVDSEEGPEIASSTVLGEIEPEISTTSEEEIVDAVATSTEVVFDYASTSTSTIEELPDSHQTSTVSLNEIISSDSTSKNGRNSSDNGIEGRAMLVVDKKAAKISFESNDKVYRISQQNRNSLSIEANKNKPEVRFKKWNDEVDFGISYNEIDVEDEATNMGNLLRWKNASSTKEVHSYPLPESEIIPGGGFEIEIVLSEKPENTTFSFDIDGHEKLNFYHQGELTDEEIADGAVRPENVINSYAIYKKESAFGKYGTGKVAHIYRPKVSDSEGNEIWGELKYEEGKLSVIVPEEFLDSAVYPVVVDPTLGYSTAGATLNNFGANHKLGVLHTLSEEGDFDSVTTYIGSQSGTGNVRGGIYAESSGSPGALEVEGGASAINTTSQWVESSLTSTTLSADDYYVTLQFDVNSKIYYDSGATDQTCGDPDTFSDGLEDPFGTPGLGCIPRIYSVYATYTTNDPPSSPTGLEAEGQTNPTNISDPTPEFSAIYDDPDTSDVATHYQIQVSTSSSFTSTYWDSGSTTLASSTSENARIADISYGGSPLASSTTYYWRIKFWDDDGAEGAWSSPASTFSLAAGSGGGGGSGSGTEYILYDDSLNSDWGLSENNSSVDLDHTTTVASGTKAIEVDFNSTSYAHVGFSTSTGFDQTLYDTLEFDIHGGGVGGQDIWAYFSGTDYVGYGCCFIGDRVVGGGGIAANEWRHVSIPIDDFATTTVPIRILIFNTDEDTTVYIDNIKFVSSTTPETNPTFPIFKETIQALTYSYDSVGNITQIIDASQTDTAATTTYSYDDLYRLTSASTTEASTTPYTRTYSYNLIGNLLTKSDQGSYTYNGHTGSNYANPHAATSIDGVTYTYDNNGNLLTIGSTISNTWNYRNELTQSVVNSETTTYTYDHTGQRVSKTGDTTTYYPSSLYEEKDGSATKHIYVNDALVASIEDDTPAPEVYYAHTDHLDSTNVMTGDDGYINQLSSYYPFGEQRIDDQFDTHNQTNRYTGHDYDEETDLSYMGARYYDGQTGRFTAQDPLSLNIGNWKEVQKDASVPLDEWIRNPQRLNTYAYAGNNPIKNIDKDGKDYYEFSADFSIQPYSVSASLKFDPQKLRLDASVGGGPAGGASAVLTGAYNPSDLPNENSYITHEAFVTGGYYVGGKLYLENQPFKDGSFSDMNLSVGGNVGVGTGIGLSTGVQASYNKTLFDLSKALNNLKGLLSKFDNSQSKQSQNEENGKKKNDKDND